MDIGNAAAGVDRTVPSLCAESVQELCPSWKAPRCGLPAAAAPAQAPNAAGRTEVAVAHRADVTSVSIEASCTALLARIQRKSRWWWFGAD